MKEKVNQERLKQEAEQASFFKKRNSQKPSSKSGSSSILNPYEKLEKMVDYRAAKELYCRVRAKEARVILFGAVLDGQDLELIKNFYMSNAVPITYGTFGRNLMWKKKSKEVKEEVLRRFELDRQVAERFAKVGLLKELIQIEEKEIQSILSNPERWSRGKIISPRITRVVKKLKEREQISRTNR